MSCLVNTARKSSFWSSRGKSSHWRRSSLCAKYTRPIRHRKVKSRRHSLSMSRCSSRARETCWIELKSLKISLTRYKTRTKSYEASRTDQTSCAGSSASHSKKSSGKKIESFCNTISCSSSWGRSWRIKSGRLIHWRRDAPMTSRRSSSSCMRSSSRVNSLWRSCPRKSQNACLSKTKSKRPDKKT